MASGVVLGPAPEWEVFRLDGLHRLSGRAGTLGTLFLSGLAVMATALAAREGLQAKAASAPPRTVTLSLLESSDEGPGVSPPLPAAVGASAAIAPTEPVRSVPDLPAPSPALLPEVPGFVAPGGTGGQGAAAAGSGHQGQAHRGLQGESGPGAHHHPGAGSLAVDAHATYRAGLAQWLAARKRYPSAARNQGRQGEVLLALELEPQGSLAQVRIERSSGHHLLDQAALALVKGCGSLPPPPPGLRLVRVSVDFTLT